MPEIATRWIETGVMDQLIAAQRHAMAERLNAVLPLLRGMDCRTDAESPLVWLPLPEPWRAGQFAAALRQAGVLIRTADHFAVGRAAAPHAVRISLNAAGSVHEVQAGVQTLLAVLAAAPAVAMDP